MPWIENCSRRWVEQGWHSNPGTNAMLIQIADPCGEFPTSPYNFKEIHQFEFLDLDESSDFGHEFMITQPQAAQLVALLQKALSNDMNVVVHCVAGICRSGAVTEVGVMMGFEDKGSTRIPNHMVKKFMMRELGWLYD